MPAFLYNARRFQGSLCRHSSHRYRGPLNVNRTTLYARAPLHMDRRKHPFDESLFVEFCETRGIDLVIAYSGLKRIDFNRESNDSGVLLQFYTEADALLFKLSYHE